MFRRGHEFPSLAENFGSLPAGHYLGPFCILLLSLLLQPGERFIIEAAAVGLGLGFEGSVDLGRAPSNCEWHRLHGINIGDRKSESKMKALS
jgi:hypothetical protein